MSLNTTFVKNLFILLAFGLILSSCGDDEGGDMSNSTDPVFKTEVSLLGLLQTQTGFNGETFESDFERPFLVLGEDADDPSFPEASNGAFAAVETEDDETILGIAAVSFDGVDTSNIIITLNPINGYVGNYDILLDENIFGEETVLAEGQGQALYITSKLPGEFIFLYFIGGLTVDQGKGSVNITDYDSEANTISGNFAITYTLNTEDDDGNDFSEDAITLTAGTFANLPVLE